MQFISSILAALIISIIATACSVSPTKEEVAPPMAPAVEGSASPMGTAEEKQEAPVPPAAVEEAVVTHVETIVDYQVICTLNDDIRRIENINTLEGGCQLDYEKFGKVKTVATAHKGAEFCQSVLERIQSNLEKGGYSCEH